MRTLTQDQLRNLMALLDRRDAEQEEISRTFAEFADAADRGKISDWLKARRQKAQRAALDQSKARSVGD